MSSDRTSSDGDASGTRRPRILVLTDDLGGGTGNHLLGMAEHWKRNGWQVEVVSFEPRTARREAPVPHTRLPHPGGASLFPVHQLRRFLQVRKLVRKRRPDIVHVYFFWPILYGRLLRLAGQIPRLVENREDEGFAWGRHEYAWLRMTRRAPEKVVCVSDAVRTIVLEREGLDREKTTVIHNGVELPELSEPALVKGLRRELGIPEGATVVGMVANLNRGVKRIDRFLDAVPAVLERVSDAYFVVVGGGRDLQALRMRVESIGLDHRILFVGYREDVDLFYEMMDVSVLTSRSEGLSITLLESMSHGVPVVATRVGGNPEVVVEGETGYLVSEAGGAGELADRVAELIVDADLRSEMGSQARERAKCTFALSEAAARYETLYLTL